MRTLVVLAIALAATAGAQAPALSPLVVDCRQVSATYVNCALWIEDGQLKRGASGMYVAHSELWSPIPLAEWVTGDSALHYALKYERNTGRGMRLSFIGAGLTLSSLVYSRFHGCREPFCSDRSHETVPAVLAGVGIGLSFVSFPFTLIGERAGVRAIWWHNASLGR